MSSQSDPNVFSVRIVSLDYYMSPPIPDLDFCYSSFQGRKVEEVPVIRIYGSTPAGQKACLHIHRALPYLYIPCPDDVLRNPEEGHAFIHILSSALEKALRHKSSSAPKKQHVHGCRLVRAKKLYGYHSSEDMFVKIYLYYPHEVARTATLLLDGAILSKTFQPYESHIPYLLQFLVDYNLYGMSHIHTAKAKFRPPIPDGYIPRVSCFKKNDMQAHGNSAIWLSSTVPSALIWPDSATGDDGLEDKTIHLIRRQSICGLEVDSSVDDILNEKYKMYTSLSQTRLEVKMVQSLVPIWEEEYERSGTPEAVQFPDLSKPLPENVLGSFLHGLEYEKALAELCIEIEKTFPSKVSAIEGVEKLEKFMESFTGTGKALTPLEHQRPGSPFGERLKCPREESKNVPLHEFHGRKSAEKTLFEMYETTKPERLDTEALGLLSWLASSQAVEDFSADDELVHEAILSPLLPTKSYREAVEIAHLDYESASQQECQDILDSVESFLKSEGSKEQVSHSAHHEYTGSVLSGNVIPQVDGSFDDNFKTPQKGDFSEANMTSGREKSSAHQVGRWTSTRFGSKCRRSNLLWRPLPFPIKQKEHEDSESAFFVSSHDEKMKNDSESSSSFGNKGDRCCDVLKVDAGVETSGEKGGKIVGTWSVRDLMRRKRCFRTEESETEVQKNEMVALCPEGPMHQTSDKERCYVMPTETPNVESSSDDRDGLVQENITCTTACTQDACAKGYRFLPTDYRSPVNQKSSISLFSDQVMQSNILLNEHLQFHKKSTDGECIEASTGSRSFAIMGQSLPQAESIKFPEPCQSRLLGTAICSTFSGGHEEEMPDASQSFMKSCSKKLSVESQKFTSRVREKQSVDEGLKSHQCESQSVDEHLLDKLDFGTGDLTTIHAEQTILHDINKYKTNQNIAREGLLETHFNRCAESDFVLNKNVQQSDNHVRGGWDMGISSLNPDCITCTDLHKGRDTLEYIEMTISRKPPSRDEVDRSSGDSPGTTGHVDGCADTNNESLAFKSCFVDSDGQWMNDFPPFFVRNLEDGKSYKSFLNDDNLVFHQESALGVPTHFQNDGSVLYLLTNAVSPPTLQCVCQWLLDVTQRNCLNDAVGNACDGTSLESNAAHHLKPDLSSSSQENIKSPKTGNYSSHIDIVSSERHVAGIHMKENALINKWHDISQISGPDREEKSKLTPLSQIGFRDPASIGGGQQLTLISMEVQAESRGDLRPDPKVDAINVLSLAVQEDTSHTFEVYVLMRGNNEELCGRNVDGVSDCKFVIFNEEKHLLDHFVKIISSSDPDVLMGWEIQGGSLGFLAERAAHLGISLLKKISRTPAYETKHKASDSANPELYNMHHEALIADTVIEDSIIEDDWGRTHASGIHVGGRIVLNVWRLMRSELKLNMYSVEAVAEEVLRRKIPSIPCRVLNHWFSSGPGRARYRCIEYVTERAKLNLQIMNQLDMVNRTSELARIFGIDFFSVLSRGSQFRVESMLLRLAHTQNYLAISPGSQQVASQPAMECLPLVMEPESGFYADPVVVLDFQSLYPSMIIAYNLCFCTCLGTVVPSKTNILGVTSYLPDPLLLKDSKQLLLTPNGIMYVPSKVRKGVLPRLLEEILSTRIMVKQAMKKLMPSQQVLQRIFNARQLALKLIANVTYGYTAAGFSGRMPCAELADSIVQCGRRTLETAISFVNQHDKWKARVIYGDTDSMFVLLKGRSREEAFRIGNEIASAITAMNPNPVTLKMEKVYHPCFLLTKKRYVGYSYESPDQDKPTFDAKGIETVRRDTCSAVAKTLERSIRLIFEHQDISVVKTYLQRQWTRILSGKFSLEDFVFAKEVRLGTYSARASSLPPAAIVATKAMRIDPRAEPRYGERIPYVVIHGEPGARLVDMVVSPSDLLDIDSPYRLNELYYINKQIIPALQRVFGLVGADLHKWFSELPRPVRPTLAKRHSYVSHSGSLHECDVDIRPESSKKAQAKRSRIDTYYISNNCTLCGELALASAYLCDRCSKKESLVATAVVGKASRLEREIQHLAAICRHCGGGDWIIESGVKCTSLACSVFYERRKVQKELQAISSFATIAGFYPSCMAEWF